VQLKLVENGKPLRDATIELYLGKPSTVNDLPYERLTSNSEGIANTSELSVAAYNLLVQLPNHRVVEFVLDVPLETEALSRNDDLELVATPRESVKNWSSRTVLPPVAQTKPLEADLMSFRGVVVDPGGAVIPNTEITIYKAESPQNSTAQFSTNDAGRFVAELAPGKYQATFYMRGFVQQRVMVFIGAGGWRGMQLTLGLGNNCGGQAPGYESKVTELN
jgi:hypothetical protein